MSTKDYFDVGAGSKLPASNTSKFKLKMTNQDYARIAMAGVKEKLAEDLRKTLLPGKEVAQRPHEFTMLPDCDAEIEYKPIPSYEENPEAAGVKIDEGVEQEQQPIAEPQPMPSFESNPEADGVMIEEEGSDGAWSFAEDYSLAGDDATGSYRNGYTVSGGDGVWQYIEPKPVEEKKDE